MPEILKYCMLRESRILILSLLFEITSFGLYFIHPYLTALPALLILSLVFFYYAFLIGPLPWVFLMVIATGLDSWGKIYTGITLFHIAWVMSFITVIYSSLTSELVLQVKFPINKFILLYILLALISLSYSPNKLEGAQLSLITLSLFILFILIANYVRTRRHFLVVVWSLLLMNVFNSLLTIYQITFQNVLYFGRGAVESSTGEKIWRASGAFYDPNILATFLFVGIILGASLIIYSDLSKSHKLLIGFSVILSIIGILATFSRTGWVSLLVGFITLMLMHKKKVYLVYLAFLIAIVMLLIVAFTSYGGFISERIYSILDISKDISIRTRIGLAFSAWQMFVDHPLLGIGFRGFPVLYDLYINPITPSALLYVKESHTLYVLLLAELGIPGLIVIILLFKQVIKDGYNRILNNQNTFYHSILVGNFSIFISFIITYLFYGNLFPDFNLIWINLGMLYTVSYVQEES